MDTRSHTRSPALLPLQARAALALIPHAGKLPFIAGGGGEVPETTITLSAARLDPAQLEAYARLCGFERGDTLPATAPHLLAFPLHLALMTDGAFPLSPIGLVHIANRITTHRPIGVGEALDLHVHAGQLAPHPRGLAFTILSEARAGGETVWQEESTMLQLGRGGAGAAGAGSDGEVPRATGASTAEEWQLPADLGRAYARVSGDRNPIHLHALGARAFGFRGAIAHGMWTKARALAALQGTPPPPYTVDVRFRKPIVLPARVSFAQAPERGTFAVVTPGDQARVHLEGELAP